MIDAIKTFFNDPLVIPIWSLALVSLAVMVLTVWRAIEAGQFDVHKLPQILDTMVLQKLVPLAIMGVTVKMVSDLTTSSALTIAYSAGVLAVLAAEAKDFITAVTGNTFPPDIPMTDNPPAAPTQPVTPGPTTPTT